MTENPALADEPDCDSGRGEDDGFKVEGEIGDNWAKNPWIVASLEDFLFYCCPECPHKSRGSLSFINHAVTKHPQAKGRLAGTDLISPSEYSGDHDEDFLDDEADKWIKLEEVQGDLEIEDDSAEESAGCKYGADSESSALVNSASHTEADIGIHRRSGRSKRVKTLNESCSENALNPMTTDHEDTGRVEFAGVATKFESGQGAAATRSDSNQVSVAYQCDKCDYRAKSRVLMTKHVRRLHDKERKHLCTECGKSFFEKWNLTDHIVAVHQKRRPYVCDKCGKAYSQKSGLSSHARFAHTEASNKAPAVRKRREWKTEPTPCERCGKILMSKYSLEKHILRTHDNVRTFGCEMCGKTFKSNSNLKDHVSQVHHNKRPFTCSLCDFGSSHKSRLEVHMKTVHVEPQDYACDSCPQVFHKRKDLLAHARSVHGKAKNHKCEYCATAFSRRRDKEKHLLKAHNIVIDAAGRPEGELVQQ